jgi:hypothetical protein
MGVSTSVFKPGKRFPSLKEIALFLLVIEGILEDYRLTPPLVLGNSGYNPYKKIKCHSTD